MVEDVVGLLGALVDFYELSQENALEIHQSQISNLPGSIRRLSS